MRIGYNLLTLDTEITDKHYKTIETIKEIGYDGVEVPIFTGKEQDYLDLGNFIRSVGLECTAVSALSHNCNPSSEDLTLRQNAQDHHKWALDCCAALGSELIIGPLYSPLGYFTGSGPEVAELERSAQVLKGIGDYADNLNINLALEPLNRFETYFLNTMEQAKFFHECVSHPRVKLMFDTFHANIEEREPHQTLQDNFQDIIHFHISENDRGTLGKGQIDIGRYMEQLQNNNYNGWVTVEAFGRALPSLAAATCVWRDLYGDLDQHLLDCFLTVKNSLK